MCVYLAQYCLLWLASPIWGFRLRMIFPNICYLRSFYLEMLSTEPRTWSCFPSEQQPCSPHLDLVVLGFPLVVNQFDKGSIRLVCVAQTCSLQEGPKVTTAARLGFSLLRSSEWREGPTAFQSDGCWLSSELIFSINQLAFQIETYIKSFKKKKKRLLPELSCKCFVFGVLLLGEFSPLIFLH